MIGIIVYNHFTNFIDSGSVFGPAVHDNNINNHSLWGSCTVHNT